MSNTIVFLYGLLMLGLFAWYFAAENERAKRFLGTALTILLSVFCVWAVTPALDQKDADGKLLVPGKVRLGLDLQGGTSFLIQLDPPVDEKGQRREITKDMLDQAMEAIRKRVDAFGVSEPTITSQGTDRILVQIPGLDDEKIKDAREQLRKVAKLEFRLVHAASGSLIPQIEAGQEVPPIGYAIEPYSYERDGKPVEGKLLVKKKPDLLGDTVTSSGAFFDSRGWGVHLNFNSEGATKFGELTKQVFEERSQMAIVMDGKIITAPGVEKGPIYEGRAEISGGSMKEKEARNLASALQNPLQTPVRILSERQVSASLGSDSIRSGLLSGALAMVLVLVFMLVYYRLVGLIAVLALGVNGLMVFGAMGIFGSVLTLPGIAGIILSLGMAIDANVLIYERLREELDAGKSLKAAIDASYDKAFSAIFDAHVTTIVTSAVLFWLATGPVRGFAITLLIGITASLFSSLLVTRNLFSWALSFGWPKRISMLHLIRTDRPFDFLGKARPFLLTSLALVVLSIGIFAWRGEHNFGTDFKGGDLLVFAVKKQPITPDQVRGALADIGLQDSVIQSSRLVDQTLISVRSATGTGEKIEKQLLEKLPEAGLDLEQKDSVGSLVGKELATRSLLALALGLLAIFVYVTARFETAASCGSLIALAHDLVITIGVLALTGREMSLVMVGALLTIAGYSINDKIVVFDRIRGDLRLSAAGTGTGTVRTIMNRAINETLSRTILTGGTVLLSVLALYIFGGPVLNDFAFASVIGVLVGTYSSIFIAAPIALWWSGRSGGDLREIRPSIEAPKHATA